MIGLLFWMVVFLAGATAAAGLCIYAFMPVLLVKIVFRWRLWKCGMHQHWIRLGDKVISYAEGGEPNPDKVTIILIHGGTSFKESWWQTVRNFPSDQHVVAFDLPGHGATYNLPDDEISLQTMTEHLHQFIRILGLDQRPFHILGQSAGGHVSARYSATYPQDVAYLSLIGPAMFTPEPSLEMKKFMEKKEPPKPVETVEDMQASMDSSLYKKTKLDKQILKGMLHMRKLRNSYYAKMMPGFLSDMKTFEEIIPKIRAPTQLIWGKYDETIHLTGIDVFRKCLPNPPTVHILSDCGHAANRDQPEELARLLLQHSNKAG